MTSFQMRVTTSESEKNDTFASELYRLVFLIIACEGSNF